jgi:regulator of protease activity HflC (stomatin/prohibitin superfamily)
MALIGYFKAEPTEYILAYANGRVFRQGAGRAFWYWRPSTSIVLVPVSTIDALFVLNESTGNYQAVTLQGQLTYRIVAPEMVAQLLNFTIDPDSRGYRSEDPARLSQRIVNRVQAAARDALARLDLETALRSADEIARQVLARLQAEADLTALGVEVLSLFVTSLRPTPEMAKALEAEYREALQQRADQAIYARRAEAVEQERKIKQNELATSIALEERRRELVDLQGANSRQQAAFEAEGTRIRLAPYQGVDTRTLLGLAFRELAANAGKIGNLTVTSELLEQLLNNRAA